MWILGVCLPALLPAQRYSFKHYLEEQGLTNLVVMSLLQDQTGFIWAGTQNGLFRYDGTRFKRYGVEDGLPSTRVYVMHRSSDGVLWVGTHSGLVRAHGERFEIAPEAGKRAVKGLASDPQGTLYVGTVRGLLVSGPPGPAGHRTFQPVITSSHVDSQAAYGVHVDPEGIVWFGCGQSLCRMESGEIDLLGPEQGVPRARWDDITTDHQGTLWIRSTRHLQARRPGAVTFSSRGAGLPPSTLMGKVYVRRDGEIVLPTDDG